MGILKFKDVQTSGDYPTYNAIIEYTEKGNGKLLYL